VIRLARRLGICSTLFVYLTLLFGGIALLTVTAAAEDHTWQLSESFTSSLDELRSAYRLEGDWKLANGELSSSGSQGAHRIGIPLVFTDFDLTVRFRVRAYGTYGYFSIVYHELYPTESYYLRINNYNTVLQRRHGYWEDYTTLASYSRSALTKPDAVQKLHISVRGNQITFSLDDGPRYAIADSQNRYPEGMIWLRADSVDMSITEFTISAPQTPTPMTVPEEVAEPAELWSPEAQLLPTGRITGTWLTILEARELLWSPAMWDLEFRAMHEIGIDTLVFRPYILDTGPLMPLLNTIFTKATEYGMQVFIHTNRTGGGYQWTSMSRSALAEALARAKQDMELIAEAYADHPAFAGWYIWDEVDEKDLVSTRLETTKWYYGELRRFASTLTPEKPMMIAPSFSSTTSPRWLEDRWADVLSTTGIDILAVQDSVGQGKSTAQVNPEYYAAFARAAKRAGAALWADVEVFTKDYQPAPAERVRQQLLAVGPWVEKTLIFDYNHYMSPTRGLLRQILYDAYLEMLQGSYDPTE
jgi:hypothetical protein